MLASPQPHHLHAPPSSFSGMNTHFRSTSSLSLKSSRSRKASLTLSNPMGWLSRHSTQSSVSSFYKGNKQNSPPPPTRNIELVHNARSGPLGQGATVVRTPEEALQDSGLRSKPSLQRSMTSASKPIESPPLPSLPVDDDEEYYSQPPSGPPTRPSSLKTRSRSSIDVLPVPPLPSHLAQPPSQPPFDPVLMTDLSAGLVDNSAVLVTLETCTATYKTTMKTLTSRPSQLSSYLFSLLPRPRRSSDASSVYSTASDDMSSYRDHLTSQGLLPQAPVNVHIFLDRPSAPYTHILNYLRSPLGTAELPELLPRAVQLSRASSQTRLEALLELRDEAAYLELDDLYRLCSDEIRQRQPVLQPRLPRTHSHGQSSSSSTGGLDSQHTSVSSMNTLLDRSAHQTGLHLVRAKELSTISDNHDSTGASNENIQAMINSRARAPPSLESWKEGRNSGSSTNTGTRSRHRNDTSSPPAGWF
jgi:hypothetical protein